MVDETFELQVSIPSTIAPARHTARARMQAWGCDNAADVELVFSELLTNATVHSTAASTTVISHGPHTVRIEVHDTSHSIPQLRHDTRPDGGLGLRIVNQLSHSWGWEQTATGKVVWAIIPCGH